MEPSAFPNSCPNVKMDGLTGFMFANLIQTIIAAQCSIREIGDSYPSDYGDSFIDNEEFDFIVVGAGSAGSVVASRLSENSAWKILLIEAGGNPTFRSEIPSLALGTYGTEIDWKYSAIPNGKSCLSLKNSSCPVPRGKTLGGSSTINAMLYVRGSPKIYNEWEDLGNPGWSYENVLPYFKKLENFGLDNVFHSTKGPLSVERAFSDPELEPVKKYIIEGFAELGYPKNDDFAGASHIGFGVNYATVHNGVRANTAKAYLIPKKFQENLKVIKNALVEKVLMQEKKAYGVVFSRKGKTFTATVTKEVILSAGAINTPQLLMLSGIGSKKQIEKFKLNFVHSLEGVGKNLQDRPIYTGIRVHVNNSISKPLSTTNAPYMNGVGPYTGIGLSDLNGFVDSESNSKVPDLEFTFRFQHKEKPGEPENFKEIRNSIVKSDIFVPRPAVLKPKSRGFVKLKSADPYDYPIASLNLLDAVDDVDTLIRGVKIVESFVNTNTLKCLRAKKMSFAKTSACNKYSTGSEPFLRCHIRHFTDSFHHACGTCKMGPKSDAAAVVDSSLKVHGIQGLRIVDASVIPIIPTGPINIPVIMIGEKASVMIKMDWDCSV